jgi:hypothetical protein
MYYVPTYPPTPLWPTYISTYLFTYLPTYLDVVPTYQPTHLHGCIVYLPTYTHLLTYMYYIPTYPPTHLSPITYLLSYLIFLKWNVKINMWSKIFDKCWTTFHGVVHWLTTWFIIREVKGSILNIIYMLMGLR